MPQSFEEFREMMRAASQGESPVDAPQEIKDLLEISLNNQALLETILENQAFIMAKLNYPDDVEKFQNAHHEFYRAMEQDARDKAETLRNYFAKLLEGRK